MITVNIWRNENGYINQYNIAGHADENMICCAVSAITQTAVYGLTKVCKHRVRFESGSGILHVSLIQAPDRITETVLQTMLEGLKEIQKRYRDAIYITEGTGSVKNESKKVKVIT